MARLGEARFEFGLAEACHRPLVPTYELPGLIDEWAASAVTRSLAEPGEAIPEVLAPPAADAPSLYSLRQPLPAMTAVGYGFGESSRLGLSMQLLNLLTDMAEGATAATHAVAVAQPPATPLPPLAPSSSPTPYCSPIGPNTGQPRCRPLVRST